ncbi:uncharacterized protein LOC110988643 [Acanthaster planci]|uniref:Uncharacterized protein LOC110988643 n=1 Tax=Acanthaster planci TaxID=133434 RepID=A0A8B7ZR64_ACAPL|nr:uncharacterized protein LOC110988643 [Acanthaster planci]
MEDGQLPLRIGLAILGLLPGPRSKTTAGRCASLWHRCRGYEILWDDEKSYGVVSFLLILLIVVFHFVDLAIIFKDYLGKRQDTVFFISYLTYLPQLTITLLFCLIARLYISCFYDSTRDRLAVFSEVYLKERLEHSPSKMWWRLLGFMALPTPCIIMKLMVFFLESGSTNCPRDAFVYIRTIGGVAGYALYGIFCFVIHCLQMSHREEFHQTAVRISKRGAPDIETTKAEIRKLCFGFRSYRDFGGRWMVLSVSIAVLGVVFAIPYTMDTLPEIRKDIKREESNLMLWTVFTWCDKVVFLAGPLLAVWGLDVGRPWRYFRERILQTWNRPGDNNRDNKADGIDSETLEAIINHMTLLKDGGSWIKSTLVSAMLSIYLGTTLDPSQDLDPWIGLACRPNFNHTE